MKKLTTLEEYILLSVYDLKDNAYLISIRDYLRDKAGIDLAIGSVFAPLDRLTRKEYLRAESSTPSPRVGGRAIKYYRMTTKGMEALHKRRKVMDIMWKEFCLLKSKS